MQKKGRAPKYPRTRHLPWSPEVASDDKRMSEEELLDSLLAESFIVVTEKMDGGNCCLTRGTVFARSHGHEAQGRQYDLLKRIHSAIGHLIPERVAVYGEWLYARHSIKYTDLPTPFLVFGVLDMETDTWLSWSAVTQVAEALGLDTVPTLPMSPVPNPGDRGKGMDAWPRAKGPSRYGPEREGYVMRVKHGFPFTAFREAVGKSVRKGHVTTSDHHWKTGDIETNTFHEIRHRPDIVNAAELLTLLE